MAQILRLAVTPVEPGKGAEQPGISLCRHDGIKLGETGRIERVVGRAPGPDIAHQQRQLERLGYVDACILRQRYHVVCGRSQHGVLEVDDADFRDTRAFVEPDQIGGMKVPYHPGPGGRGRLAQQIAPHRDEFVAHFMGRLDPAVGQIPFEHQSGLNQQRIGVEGGYGVGELGRQRQNEGQYHAMQRRQHVGSSVITFLDRPRRIAFDKARAAEILGDQESVVEVGVMNDGRREPALAQAAGDGDKRLHVFGQMNHRAV